MLELRQNINSTSLCNTLRNLTIVSIFLLGVSSFSQVTTSIDTTTIRIGEEILYTIQVEADSTDLVMFPEGQTFKPLEVIESYKIDTTRLQDKIKLIKKYGLTQFDSGTYTIPRQRIVINNKPFNTDSVRVEVFNVLVDTTKQKMFHIKPALEVKELPFDFEKAAYWLLPILVIIGIGILLFFRRRKKKREEAEQQLPPYEEAIEALKELDHSHYLKNDNSKRYYSELTEILKRYIGREVDDSALESTSNELIERLILHKDSGNFDFDTETIKKIDAILKRADLIKFAKMKEQEGQAKVDRSVVEEIINETKEIIPEPTEEELLKNAIYLEELRKKALKRKRIKIALGAVVTVILAAVIFGSIKGFDELKDKTLGNKMRDLSEGRWIKSEYGSPLIIVETPEVLVRVEDSLIPNSQVIKRKSVFSYGQITDPLYVMVNSIQFNQEQKLELESSLDMMLTLLEKAGAKNLVVKRDDFKTEKGIEGIKAHGDFHVEVSEGKVLKKKSSYELLLFAQENGLQEILIVYQDDGRFAEDIKDRIINSIELEITPETKKKDGQ
ncbi:MAG: BatD family protein [Flavobacteriaceae bacterium]|nr:BatD family protein [Flavobacteriaceae bacterium]